MKPYKLVLFYWPLLALAVQAEGQNTRGELQAISQQLVNHLNNKNFQGKLIVFDFTDHADNRTGLGAHLANIFSNQLVNSSGKFTIIDREATINQGSSRGGAFVDALKRTVQQEANNYLGSKEADIAKTMSSGLDVLKNPNTKDKRLKGVDAIAYGTITTVGDHYSLNIKVRSRKNDALIATAEGDISNTDALASLHGSTLPLPGAVAQVPGNGTGTTPQRPTPPSNPNHLYKKLHLKFELLECKNNARYVECYVRVTSEETDSELSFNNNGTKIFNQNRGKEYDAISIKLSDQQGTGWVKKYLIKDSPVEAVITFEPGENIQVISTLAISAYDQKAGGSFFVDLRDIFVK